MPLAPMRSCDVRLIRGGLHGNANIGPRQVDAAVRNHGSLACEIVERLLGQYDDVGILATAQAIQQAERRREIGIDARAACRLVSSGKAANRPHQCERREHPNHILHRQSLIAICRLRPQARLLLAGRIGRGKAAAEKTSPARGWSRSRWRSHQTQ
jgi:hypothetical protein